MEEGFKLLRAVVDLLENGVMRDLGIAEVLVCLINRVLLLVDPLTDMQ